MIIIASEQAMDRLLLVKSMMLVQTRTYLFAFLSAICNVLFTLGLPGAGAQTTSTVASVSASTEYKEDDYHLLKPIVWGDNRVYKLQFGGEVRARGEYRDNFDLEDSDDSGNDGFGFLRTRTNFDLTYGTLVRAFVEILDAREIDADREQNQEDYVDLHQAFLDLKQPHEGPWTLRLGRQEMDLGRDNRLTQASGWSNLRQRFDGVRAMYRTKKLDAELFLLHPNSYKRRRGNDIITGHGRPRNEEYYYGAYITSRHLTPHTLEAYFLGLTDKDSHRTFDPNRKSEDGTYGSSNRYTVGSVLYGPLYESDDGELSYTGEGAFQFGRYSKDQIRSYFLRGDLTYEWKRPWKPTLGLVGTLASGDRDPDDGINGGFDNLYGSNHSPYGIMDFVRPGNLRELALIGKIQPTKKLSFQAEAHSYWLDSKTGEGIDAPGEDGIRDVSGRSGRDIGQEVSLSAEYQHSKRLTFEAGAARFFPGAFPAAQGRNDAANFFFLQTRYRF